MTVSCSCGTPNCKELGWPHEWDPIAAGDSCLVVPPPAFIVTVDDTVYVNGDLIDTIDSDAPHRVTEPYERWGSGYACVSCIRAHTIYPPPRDRNQDSPH